MTMKLYIQNGSCSLAPQAIANETGLELELINVDVPAKKYGSDPDY